MYFTLGCVIVGAVPRSSITANVFAQVKGGKVISTGFNHQRPNYECREPLGRAALANGLPFSMHAEMAAIFKLTRGEAPALKQQVQPHKLVPKTTRTRKQGAAARGAKLVRAEAGGRTQGFLSSPEPECRSSQREGSAHVLSVELPPLRTGPKHAAAAAAAAACL